MKFLGKKSDSEINGLTYQKNRSTNNRKIHDLLLSEQKNFCAYTEKFVQSIDSTEVEHFNSSIKYNDGYYNYYVVLRKANEYKIKKDNLYRGACFFDSLFFQSNELFNRRIRFIDGVYEELDAQDNEAKDFIDFLGFNNPILHETRMNHVQKLKSTFEDAQWDTDRILQYFNDNRHELSFITALEHEFNLNLEVFCE